MGPIKLEKVHDKGGHFAGMLSLQLAPARSVRSTDLDFCAGWERPDAVAADLCEMLGKGGGAYGVVSGKDGY